MRCWSACFTGYDDQLAFPVGFQCRQRNIQAGAEYGNVRLRGQSLLDTPVANIGIFCFITHRQAVLCLTRNRLPEIPPTGDQQVGLSGKFLVEPPVTPVGCCAGYDMAVAAGVGDRDTSVKGGDEIAEDERSAGTAPGMQAVGQVQAFQ